MIMWDEFLEKFRVFCIENGIFNIEVMYRTGENYSKFTFSPSGKRISFKLANNESQEDRDYLEKCYLVMKHGIEDKVKQTLRFNYYHDTKKLTTKNKELRTK